MSSFYPEGTIVLTGVSKWAGAGGWRMGAFIFPTELAWLTDMMTRIASHFIISTSLPIQWGSIPAFSHHFTDEYQSYLNVQRRIFGGLAHFATNTLRKCGATMVPPTGGFYAFPDFSTVPNIDQMKAQWAKKTGMRVFGFRTRVVLRV